MWLLATDFRSTRIDQFIEFDRLAILRSPPRIFSMCWNIVRSWSEAPRLVVQFWWNEHVTIGQIVRLPPFGSDRIESTIAERAHNHIVRRPSIVRAFSTSFKRRFWVACTETASQSSHHSSNFVLFLQSEIVRNRPLHEAVLGNTTASIAAALSHAGETTLIRLIPSLLKWTFSKSSLITDKCLLSISGSSPLSFEFS